MTNSVRNPSAAAVGGNVSR